jgi:hypothetical protein
MRSFPNPFQLMPTIQRKIKLKLVLKLFSKKRLMLKLPGEAQGIQMKIHS